MKESNAKWIYLLLGVLIVAVAVQSYLLYDVKKSVAGDRIASTGSSVNLSSAPADDFFNNFPAQRIDPFEQMKKMQEEMQKSFGQFNMMFSNDPLFQKVFDNMSVAPLSDLKEDGNEYIIELNIPGADEQKIDIQSHGNQLDVRASSERSSDVNGTNYIHRERFSQRFERSFTLPDDADVSNMTNSYTNGILKIVIPKKG